MTHTLTHGESTFGTADGLRLYRQWWLPTGDPHAAVMLLHGLGEHSGRYGHLAAAMVRAGFAVHALDHRGHGRSEGRRVFVRRYGEFMSDIDLFRDLVEGRHPGVPLVVLGHSMGGNLALGHVLDHQEGVTGLAVSAPALKVGGSVNATKLRVAKLLARRAPTLPGDALDASAVSRDPSVVTAYQADPLVHTGRMTVGVAGALLEAIESFPPRYPELRLPLLVLQGTADRLVDPDGARELVAGAVNAEVTAHFYEGLFHEVFNEPERDQVIGDLVTWLGALSGAAEPRR